MPNNEELLLEMAQFGKIDGKPIQVYFDDHNPPLIFISEAFSF